MISNSLVELECTDSQETLRESVQRTYREFTSRPLYSFSPHGQVTADDRLAVATVCKRPEFRPLLQDIVFDVGKLNDLPFVIQSHRRILINRQVLRSPILAAFHLRHALELAALRSSLGDAHAHAPAMSLAVAILAFHTTLSYLDGMIHQEKVLLLEKLPEWLQGIADRFRHYLDNEHSEPDISAVMADCRDLLLLQGQDVLDVTTREDQSAMQAASGMVHALLPLAHPAEHILTTGGDSRLIVDEQTGLNSYGCSPRPRPWAITFSSCTASSISDLAFQEAEWLRQSLFKDAWQGRVADRCEAELQHIREVVAELLELEQLPGTEIILTPSGTDSELYALYFSMGVGDARVCNILISSTEIGSGTVHAAGGCHFDVLTPHSRSIQPGTPLEGFPCHRVDVPTLELRHDSGAILKPGELESAAQSLVSEAIRRGERVLIHLLDCSKTGIGGPGFETIRELRRNNPSSVSVVVDAAQMRVGRAALRRYLEEGFLVLITASKFFTGPPFSGALLVPPAIAGTVPNLDPLPPGFASYSSKQDLPRNWWKLAQTLQPEANLGLLLRWRSALWEMKAFYSVSARDQYNTLYGFAEEIRGMIRNNPDLDLVMAPPHDRGYMDTEVSWDQIPCIFTFLVHHRKDLSDRQPLTYDEACIAYRCVNMDIARFLPLQASHWEHELARQRCHIGQPVRICQESGRWIGGLRIAAGARLVSGVEFDDALGDAPRERLETEIRSAAVVLNKISVIVKYWQDLVRYDLRSGATANAGFYLF